MNRCHWSMASGHWLMILVFCGCLALLGCGQPDEGVGETAVLVVTSSATPVIGVSLATRARPTTAVVQTTPTPLPTATATLTPTPIVYFIEAGDTILGLAIEQNRTVDEILALNPEVRPELLQIGQAIVLPPPQTTVVGGNVATAVPPQLRITQLQTIETAVGSLWVLGELVNEGRLPVADARVQIDFLTAEAGVAKRVLVWASLSLLPAGERSPFGILVMAPPAETIPSVTIVGGISATGLGPHYLEVAVAETAVLYEGEQVSFSGQLENNGVLTATQVTVVATLYDSLGQMSGYQQWQLADDLLPGARAPFSFTAVPPGGPAVEARLVVQALRRRSPDA